MTLEAITFDLGGMPPVEVQLASGSGLAPLPMPEAILRFRAAMEGAPEQGEMPERTMVKEQPVAPQMTAARTQPEPELRIFGRGPHVVLTEPMAADRLEATEAPVAQTTETSAVVAEKTAVRPKETPVGVVDKPVVTPTEAPVAPEKPMVVPVAVEKPVAEVPVAPVKTIEVPVTIERSAIQPAEVPVKPVGTAVKPVEAPVVAAMPVVKPVEAPVVAATPVVKSMEAPVVKEQPVVATEKPVAEVPVAPVKPETVVVPEAPVAPVKNASDLAASVKPVKKPSVPDKQEAPAPAVQVAVPAAIDTPVPQTVAPQVAPVAQPEVLRAEAASARTATIVETVNAVVEEVAAQISVTPTLAQGEGEIRIVLKPTVLDGSEIRLSAKEGTLTVAIAPATPESAQTVAVALPRLETALAEHAPAFNQVAVVVATAKKGKTNETA
ncbi:MAG: hypothetical protein IKP97_04345 [Kiritimatiellae bacterium]|nr:hypothetical protein [Kiritimatiellia bacterium]